MNSELCIHVYMIRKKYGMYKRNKPLKYVPLYYNGFNHYNNVITTITKLQSAIKTLHSPKINIQ